MHPFEQVSPPEVSCNDAKSLHSLLKTLEQAPLNKCIEIPSEHIVNDDQIGEHGCHDIGIEMVNPIHELLFNNASEENLGTNPQISNGMHSTCVSTQNLDQNGDFSYSQKLFHIADGNLYSIFSPLQGRSYGVKPSFLRKQRCTVQECHGRGRKHLRKGLKFHNFLPSESVTSEKDNSNFDDKWKVHSECRLREEHGTKQIMISNWSSSAEQQPATINSNDRSEMNSSNRECSDSANEVSFENESGDVKKGFKPSNALDNKTFSSNCKHVPLISHTSQTGSVMSSNQFFQESSKKQQSMLNNILSSIKSSNVRRTFANFEVESEENEGPDKLNASYCDRRHRRKPVHTRRIVPYVKYLSLLEENESCPLDLSRSSPCNPKQGHDSALPLKQLEHQTKEIEEIFLEPSTFSSKLFETEAFTSTAANNPDKLFSLNPHSNYLKLNNGNREQNPEFYTNVPLTFLYPLPMKQSDSLFSENLDSKGDCKLGTSSKADNLPSYCNSLLTPNSTHLNLKSILNNNESTSNMSSGMCVINDTHKDSEVPSIKTINHRKPRRRSQRSVIKQKLEDTFRQNGFLVKTKQVSDGEATFCKFRQLRKYTRYYLKSWQQHLPDEVHKMWKGFLPPKTVLPPVLGTGTTNR